MSAIYPQGIYHYNNGEYHAASYRYCCKCQRSYCVLCEGVHDGQ